MVVEPKIVSNESTFLSQFSWKELGIISKWLLKGLELIFKLRCMFLIINGRKNKI